MTQSLRNSITQIRLRNSSKRHHADYANTDFNYAEILVITQWATSSADAYGDLQSPAIEPMTTLDMLNSRPSCDS